jgi:hypothetical protein
MGNGWTRQRNLEELKFAELHELTGIEFPTAGNLRRYTGFGYSSDAALLDLIDVCDGNGIPLPQKVNGRYVCGTIKVHYFFKTRTRLNPVFTEQRNGRFVAYVYSI